MSSNSTPYDCLIGNTGFVGGALQRQHSFQDTYNSRNISEIFGKSYTNVVCAAAPGSMFEANKFPQRDHQKTEALCEQLRGVRAKQFILISSIAVLEDFAGQDDEDTVRFQNALAYGRNRRTLEEFCSKTFENCLIVRLPALFGEGLRKNFIFDLLNPMPSMIPQAKLETICAQLTPELAQTLSQFYRDDPSLGMLVLDRAAYDDAPQRRELDRAVDEMGASAVQFHNPATTYQYYDTSRLWDDISTALNANLDVLHLATEPLRADVIHHALTGKEMPHTNARLHAEDMRTRHAGLWQREGGYIEGAESVLTRLQAFYSTQGGL